jgi:hypothetical protein
MNTENIDTFGNYLIHGIDEIILPDAISWLPSAPGWRVVWVILCLFLVVKLYRFSTRWWHNRYRREALRQLEQLQQQAGQHLLEVVSALPYYIKVTALQAYPRHDVASLSGNRWLAFLDAHYSGPSFREGVGKNLLYVSYLPREKWRLNNDEATQLITLSRQWIASHKEASHV